MIILNFNIFIVAKEWCPCIEDSRLMSRHHKNIFIVINIIINIICEILIEFFLKKDRIEVATANKEQDVKIGQGLGEIK